jgi:bifunctional UDP-N-acetylglucosamine pyrophosphorylase/glucosamine-1-phosphate N-acetyltransferase
MDTIIGPFTQILGRTRIGEDCVVGACSIVEDSELADGVEIGAFTVVGASRVARAAHIGPFARLRFGNVVEEGAHIGNFVELKKAHLGAGSKANHLAYLGDAEIGANTNVGAGTITCNYDGAQKHSTKIGERVFVGSNATLVAPLEIGDGAYLGAGSVITEAVPAESLALGRARQVLKPEWAARRRRKSADAQ